ncbi:dTDP-4-dehydrorhamnose 3,5-epimerase [Mucilaginibacter frigoritolerans]|jgi:dTDP-4-dehydrorhamnose 3,5-epimerase|uniref:dTDP-4-dehydrorhamnose 3,5-epimerase n=1 Tax=Mucilaginibacter frigoritolerans TaxID=652788 RepID=A0A562U3C2_9SPHI|nr:dTDP-4-dehydrorhamnose 3,5-epimerase [Mucilaginibacter frigoritolerans]TWJ00069.1 dTDP-4-dehydrorhamnose 3,5-epimerase [Mucilaginibacter frigoritolerans]
MKITKTAIEGLLIVEPRIFNDDRGYFYESYNKNKFVEAGINVDFVQDNQSFSHKGAVRGLHGQADPFAQGKLVRVISGRVLDVAVDIRKNSATYGKHISVELSGENKLLFWIPRGFLHGFATLEDNTIFTYKVNNLYDKESEIGVIWNDADLGIDWGISKNEILLSPKDEVLPAFKDFVSPF